MRQPHLLRLSLLRQLRGLCKCHMLVADGLLRFLRLPIHPLTDKQICILCMLCDRRHRTGIRAIDYLQSLSLRTEHIFRMIRMSIRLDCLAFLQTIPELHRNLRRLCALHVKSSGPCNLHRIAIANHIMIHPKCPNPIPVFLKDLLIPLNFFVNNRKRKLRCNHTKRIYDTLQPLRPDQGQRLRAVRISHRQKQPRKAADMISMIMGKTDRINRLKAPALLLYCDLRPFSTVN